MEERILLVITDPPGKSLDDAVRRYGDLPVSVLNLDPQGGNLSLPDPWECIEVADLLDVDALRHDFMAFLDAWPRKPLVDGRSFDEMFRRPEGYSLWWTGPGTERHPDRGLFPKLKILWVFDRAVKSLSPDRILLHTRQSDVARCLVSRCRQDDSVFEFLAGSVAGTHSPWQGRIRWLVRSLICWLGWPWLTAVRALSARVWARPPRGLKHGQDTPAVVISSELFRCFHVADGRVTLSHWRELCGVLEGGGDRSRLFFLLSLGDLGGSQGYRAVLHIHHTGWRLLRRFPKAAAVRDIHFAWGAQLRGALGHLASIQRYYRLERLPVFRQSLWFAGADVSSIYVPRLRRVVMRMGQWTQVVGATVQATRAFGEVGVMVVNEEMYESGAQVIAAAAQLGIPTVGVQHGTIFPMHLVYAIPPGHVEGAPIPDYFAVYGEYVKETVSIHGAYPAERVWVVGGPKFDQLGNGPPCASSARERLGLPAGKRVVLIATQCYPWFQQVARAVFEAVKNETDCVVCLKTHPRDVPLDVYRRIAQEVGAENVRYFNDQFDDLLAACDVLVSGASTSVLEAIVLGRRAICANFSAEPDRYPYVADGGAIGAHTPEEMRAALREVFSPDHQAELKVRQAKFLQRHVGPAREGRAAKVLAEMIWKLCRRDDRQDR